VGCMSTDLVGGWTASEVQFIDLADQVGAEAVVRFLLDELESAIEVDASGGGERVVGPQPDAPVAGVAGELKASVHEATTEAMAASVGVN